MERLPRAEGEVYVPPAVREFSPQARHEVPLDVANSTQLTLMNLMTPDRLKPYLGTSTGLTEGIEDAIFMKWHEKYAKKFALLCEKMAQEEGDMDDADAQKRVFTRLVEGRSTPRDYEKMKEDLESEGGTFFTDSELDDFIKENLH